MIGAIRVATIARFSEVATAVPIKNTPPLTDCHLYSYEP
jgi:hypothetical protein